MREKRQQREEEILQQACYLVEEQGFFEMKISELAKRCQLSIGTLYSHYACKEDVLIALAIKGQTGRTQAFRLGAESSVQGLKKYVAACLLGLRYGIHYPSLNEALELANTPSIIRRASPELCSQLRQDSEELWQFLAELIAEYQDELNLGKDSGKAIVELNMGAWALFEGTNSVAVTEFSEMSEKERRKNKAVFEVWEQNFIDNLVRLFSGWGWRCRDTDALIHRLQHGKEFTREVEL